MVRALAISVGLTGWLAATPLHAFAQATAGGIAGVVRDSTGAVLPGVTVEASSSALIEKVRTVLTDADGQFKIIDLRPGTYAVAFTLAGYNTIRREGIEISTGFTAAVNAELRVGDVTETITVAGASPILDLQNTRQQNVMTRDVIDTIPTGQMYTNLAVLIPGMNYGLGTGLINQDVGGQSGQSHIALAIHGGRLLDQQMALDGMSINNAQARQDAVGNMLVQGNFQEYVVEYSGNPAEVEGGGVRVNLIPKEGSNTFRYGFDANFSTSRMQSNNFSEELRTAGLRDPNRVKMLWNLNPTVSGPILQDKLWFFGSFTSQRNDIYAAGTYFSKDVTSWFYNPDFSRQAAEEQRTRDGAARVTWQATPRNKFTAFYNDDWYCQCYYTVGRGTSPEASFLLTANQYFYQATWTSPVTNRLLLEAGFSDAPAPQSFAYRPESVAPRIVDSGIGVSLRATQACCGPDQETIAYRGSISYVTGSHAMKFGFSAIDLFNSTVNDTIGHLVYTTVNGIPSQVTYRGDPISTTNTALTLGLYAQDQWTMDRVTVNAGLRFDRHRSEYPDHYIPPTEYVPQPRLIPGLQGTSWKDLSPRLGASYNLFGNGKTALKGTVGRYVVISSINTTLINPISNNNTDPRRWTDNGDYVIQGDPFNPAANGELGPSTNLNFGKPIISAAYDPAWATGFRVRPYNWEFSAGVQHEVVSGISVNVTYYRRINGNYGVTANSAVTEADFSPFCVTAPVDARLPGGGGYNVCGFFDINPGKVGQTFSFLTAADTYGEQRDHFDGVDLTVNARLQRLLLQGGLSTGKTMADHCGVTATHPQVVATSLTPSGMNLSSAGRSTEFCRVEYPFLTQGKAMASYTLPWDVQVAATYQDLPGPEIAANAVFTSAQIAPSLGRPLSAASSLSLNIVKPGTLYGERARQFDLRFAKRFTINKARLQGILDLYNAFNGSPVLVLNNTYGATTGAAAGAAWLVPQGILPARLLKMGVQIDF